MKARSAKAKLAPVPVKPGVSKHQLALFRLADGRIVCSRIVGFSPSQRFLCLRGRGEHEQTIGWLESASVELLEPLEPEALG